MSRGEETNSIFLRDRRVEELCSIRRACDSRRVAAELECFSRSLRDRDRRRYPRYLCSARCGTASIETEEKSTNNMIQSSLSLTSVCASVKSTSLREREMIKRKNSL